MFGDQALAVEAGDLDIGHRFHPVIFAGAVLRAVVLHRDHLCGRGCSYRIVNDHYPVGPVNADAVNADTAGQPNEGQPRLPAHAARTLKGEVTMCPGAKVQADTFGTEQGPGLLLPDQVFLSGAAPVEDAGEVHIENDVREIRRQLPTGCSGEGIAAQHAHSLIEQCVIVLLMGRGK